MRIGISISTFNKLSSLVFCAVLLSLAVGMSWLKGYLKGSLDEVREAYQLNVDLSQHKSERLRTYEGILQEMKLPAAKRISVNALIQEIQGAASSHQLSMEELKPITEDEDGRKRIGISLAVECRMTDLLNFLYYIAKSEDFVYVEQISISKSMEYADTVRVQMKLGQHGSV